MPTKKSYWQLTKHIVGPATKDRFPEIGQKRTRDAIENFIVRYANGSTNLLDAGCNTGIEAFRLFDKGFKGLYFGTDSNARALVYAVENLRGKPAHFVLADIEHNLPFPPRFFDIVLCKDIVEHLETYETGLSNLTAVTLHLVILSMFMPPHDGDGDHILRHRDGYFLNAYSRSRLYSFMERKLKFGDPRQIYKNSQDEVLLFRRLE
jgi:SAM-dependent methyltransferase